MTEDMAAVAGTVAAVAPAEVDRTEAVGTEVAAVDTEAVVVAADTEV